MAKGFLIAKWCNRCSFHDSRNMLDEKDEVPPKIPACLALVRIDAGEFSVSGKRLA
jgi:hypothetical protein